MKTLLITGFEPFGGASVNPAWEAVNALPERIGAYRLRKLRIPVEFGEGAALVLKEAERINPDVILSVGQAGGRKCVTPEMAALNLRFARIPDNSGNSPEDVPIVPEGREAYFATVPVRKMAEAIKAAGIPAEVSYSAGVYVCNDVLYTVLWHYSGTPVRAGFIHLPFLPEQGEPNLTLEQDVKALAAAVSVL